MLSYHIIQKNCWKSCSSAMELVFWLNHNKTKLVKFLLSEWEKKNIAEKVTYVTYGEKCVCLKDNQGVPALYCTQKEAGTRMILHAKHATDRCRDIVIHTPDTDLVVLAIAFSKDIDSNILVKTGVKNNARIISIERIRGKLVKHFSLKNISSATDAIIGLHAFAGCDTVSALWGKGKVRPLKLLLTNGQYIFPCALLGNEWTVSENLMKVLEKFVCAVYGSPTSKGVNTLR